MANVATGVGKFNGDEADDDDDIGPNYDGEDKDDKSEEYDESFSKKTDDNSGGK